MSEIEGPRRCAVLGSPISHSLSPVIHRAAYRHLGLDWHYGAHDVGESALAGFLATRGADWRGLSLTMPLKRVALELADEATNIARTVGAANTLLRGHDGRWAADNTDVAGVVATLSERQADTSGSVCVWGGGATAASVLAALASMGTGAVHVHARSEQRAAAALAVAEALGQPAAPVAWAVNERCHEAATTICTAPAGAVDPWVAEIAARPQGRLLFDVVYAPWPTPLAAAWAAGHGAVAGGLDLLVHQAVEQVRLMTGSHVPADVLRAAAAAAMDART